MPRRLACSSARWRSIRIPSRRRAGWRPTLASRVLDGMTDSAAADIARAEGLIAQALAASPRSPLAHFAKGQVLRAQRRFEEAIPEYETVLAFNRNWVRRISRSSAGASSITGSIEAGDPGSGASHPPQSSRSLHRCLVLRIGVVHLLQSRTDEAIVWLEKARSANPAAPRVHANSPPPMPSKARPNAPPPNSPKPAG